MGEAEDQYSIGLDVRDYEVDLQGIVNNAVYFHYFEHARNSYIRSRGLDLARMHEAGLDPVVTRAEIDYRVPLRAGDCFRVSLDVRREGRLKLVFEERITRIESAMPAGAGDGPCVASGRFVIALLRDGRPVPVAETEAAALFPPNPN